MTTNYFSCLCCPIYTTPYTHKEEIYDNNKPKKNKAGICFYNTKTRKILVIQSRGNLWGLPKGSMENKDIPENLNISVATKNCALREVLEETGIRVDYNHLLRKFVINKTTYFLIDLCEYSQYMKCIEEINNKTLNSLQSEVNDSTGISFMSLDCLNNHYQCLNSNCKRILKYLFNTRNYYTLIKK